MGTSKHLVTLLALALGGILLAGPAASAPSPQGNGSNTRFAICVVRIAVDPAIMPLDLGSIESLLQGSGVVYRAAREVLSLNIDKPEDFALIKVEWLNTSSALIPPGARPSRQMGRGGPDAEMMRQMEQVYGRDYRQQRMGLSREGKKDGTNEDRPAESPQREGASGASGQSPSGDIGTSGPAGTTVTGGMPMAGGMGGYGGGRMSGMGGYGGGMMAGYGGMGLYGTPGAARRGEAMEHSATVKLIVDLPESVPPRADEFLKAVIRNLQGSLTQAYEAYTVDLRVWLQQAREQHRAVEAGLAEAAQDSPAARQVREQLDTIVDVSALRPQTPLAQAVEVLRKSVNPPLNIVVLWRDMLANADVEPASPISTEGSEATRLATALDLLVKGLSAGEGKPLWTINDDTIVIGTAATLGEPPEMGAWPTVETDARNLAGQRSELVRRMQALELDLAGLDARQQAVQEQIAATQAVAKQRLAKDSMTRELQRLLAASEATLAQLKKAAGAGRASMVDVSRGEEGVAKARIDLARRQEELTRQAGGGQLEEFTKELSHLAVDKAEKEAQLQVVRRQLDEVQRLLAQVLTFDPEAERLRLAREALDITGRRVAELQTRMADLQPPMVLVVGADQ